MRDKYRFKRLFRVRLWWEFFYSELHNLGPYYCADGSTSHDTPDEYAKAYKRQRLSATQYANECVGRL